MDAIEIIGNYSYTIDNTNVIVCIPMVIVKMIVQFMFSSEPTHDFIRLNFVKECSKFLDEIDKSKLNEEYKQYLMWALLKLSHKYEQNTLVDIITPYITISNPCLFEYAKYAYKAPLLAKFLTFGESIDDANALKSIYVLFDDSKRTLTTKLNKLNDKDAKCIGVGAEHDPNCTTCSVKDVANYNFIIPTNSTMDTIKRQLDNSKNKILNGGMIIACHHGQIDNVKLLGVYIHQVTPDMIRGACHNGYWEIVKVLMNL